LEPGSIVRINYVERVKSTGRVIHTNVEEVAREAGILDEQRPWLYGPVPYIVGSGRMPEGVEDALREMKVGEEREFDVPPEKAFGRRNRRLMNAYPLSFFRRRGITPAVGLPIRTRRGVGIIRSTTGGRVWVDYNHPLAGQTMQYRLQILEEVKDPEEKIRSILQIRLPDVDPDSHSIDIAEGKAVVDVNTGDLPDEARKQLLEEIVAEIREHVPEVSEVVTSPPESEEEAAEEEEQGGGEGEVSSQGAESTPPAEPETSEEAEEAEEA